MLLYYYGISSSSSSSTAAAVGAGEDAAAAGNSPANRPHVVPRTHGDTRGMGVWGLSPITARSRHGTEGSLAFGFVFFLVFIFFCPRSSLFFIVKLQTFPPGSLRATTFPTLPSLETPKGSRKREVCDKQMGNGENSQTKRGMRRRREQGADSWLFGVGGGSERIITLGAASNSQFSGHETCTI